NTPHSHSDLPHESKLIYDDLEGGLRDEDRVYDWAKAQEIRSGKYTLRDHCFELPHKPLEARKAIQGSVPVGRVTHPLKVGGNHELEVYDWPGEYAQRFDGVDGSGGDRAEELQKLFEDNARTVAIRMQEETSPGLVVEGASNCRQMTAGHKFTLQRHF